MDPVSMLRLLAYMLYPTDEITAALVEHFGVEPETAVRLAGAALCQQEETDLAAEQEYLDREAAVAAELGLGLEVVLDMSATAAAVELGDAD
jgi:hypothetical protein